MPVAVSITAKNSSLKKSMEPAKTARALLRPCTAEMSPRRFPAISTLGSFVSVAE